MHSRTHTHTHPPSRWDFLTKKRFSPGKRGRFPHRRKQLAKNVQGVFFNWCSPKINKYGKKFKYQNWCPPKIYKYGEKLKYQNWCPPKHY